MTRCAYLPPPLPCPECGTTVCVHRIRGPEPTHAELVARVADLERERDRLARELDDARQEAAHQRLRRIEWTECANDLRAEANDLHRWLVAALEDGLAECERLREKVRRQAGELAGYHARGKRQNERLRRENEAMRAVVDAARLAAVPLRDIISGDHPGGIEGVQRDRMDALRVALAALDGAGGDRG